MKYLIKNCKVLHRGSKLHGKKVDILIDKGKITSVGAKISDAKATKIIGSQLVVSIGWMDIGTHLGEPGYEHRETFETLSNAAKKGGFTAIKAVARKLAELYWKLFVKGLDYVEKGIESYQEK